IHSHPFQGIYYCCRCDGNALLAISYRECVRKSRPFFSSGRNFAGFWSTSSKNVRAPSRSGGTGLLFITPRWLSGREGLV
ncbi:uncharacterized protein METZ01_LOCUS470800, partial [marine metagenome]